MNRQEYRFAPDASAVYRLEENCCYLKVAINGPNKGIYSKIDRMNEEIGVLLCCICDAATLIPEYKAFRMPWPAAGSRIPAASPHKIMPSLHNGLNNRHRILAFLILPAKGYLCKLAGGKKFCFPFSDRPSRRIHLVVLQQSMTIRIYSE
jgi:hypothetical protein